MHCDAQDKDCNGKVSEAEAAVLDKDGDGATLDPILMAILRISWPFPLVWGAYLGRFFPPP